jgi:acid phosphatase
VAHPSLPNYLALTGGSTFGLTSDCTTCWLSEPNIADTLEGAGKTWKAYMESMPSSSFVGDRYPYVQKHDPFIYFNDIRLNTLRCQDHVVPLSQMALDSQSAATTPSFAFITPNICNDMHDCSVRTGDTWLMHLVPALLATPAFTTQRSLLALTWDEADSTGNNQVPMILLGAGIIAGFNSSVTYNHYSMLRTVEAVFGLPTLTPNDSGAAAMTDFFAASHPCISASLTPNAASPQPTGAAVSFAAASTGCPSPVYEFALQYPDGAWVITQSFSSSNVWAWDTTGYKDGSYTVAVLANESGSDTSTYQSSATVGFGLTSTRGPTNRAPTAAPSR